MVPLPFEGETPAMRRTFKSRFGVVGVVALVALLPACADGGNDADSGTSGEKASLRFAGFDTSQTPAMQALIDAFQKSQDDVTVKYETVPFNQYAT